MSNTNVREVTFPASARALKRGLETLRTFPSPRYHTGALSRKLAPRAVPFSFRTRTRLSMEHPEGGTDASSTPTMRNRPSRQSLPPTRGDPWAAQFSRNPSMAARKSASSWGDKLRLAGKIHSLASSGSWENGIRGIRVFPGVGGADLLPGPLLLPEAGGDPFTQGCRRGDVSQGFRAGGPKIGSRDPVEPCPVEWPPSEDLKYSPT